jgi:Apea-like HEPN
MLNDEGRLQCIAASEFILSEMDRFQKLFQSKASFTQTFGDDHSSITEFMSKVMHAETGREYTCGGKALKSFRNIASIALAERADAEDFDASGVAERLRDTFLSFVFADVNKPLNDYVERWIEAAIHHVHTRHRRYSHYIPCVALQIGQGDTYSFGPITFSRKSVFREQALSSFKKYEAARNRLSEKARRNAEPGLRWCWERHSAAPSKTPEETFEELTKGVDWIAKVSVPRCAHTVSETRAEAALRATLSSLVLLLHGTEGAGLRLGNDPFTPWKTNTLTSIGEGVFRPSSSWKFGMPTVAEGWQEHIADRAEPILAVIHHLIQQVLDGQTSSFGFQIALRAITWYADAIRDSNVETRLIKCATAIECLIFPERGNATATFVIRGSLLAQRQEQPMSYWAPIAKRLYERRSDVTHGNVDSLRTARNESSHKALEFTRNLILQFLVFCHRLQPLGPRHIGTKKDFVELYRECEANFPDEIATIVNDYGFRHWKIVRGQSR